MSVASNLWSRGRCWQRIDSGSLVQSRVNISPKLCLRSRTNSVSVFRVGVNSAPELDFLANSKSNSGIELELALPSPGGIRIELELPSFELELRSSELNSELPSRNWNPIWGPSYISVAYYSRRLAQVVYTLLVHIDTTKEIRGQLCNCSHNNETVGSYQPFHDQVGHGLTITGQWCCLEKPSHTSPVTLYLAELLSLFDQQADLLLS